jgi:N-acyl-D-amino-acid deacylase
MILRLLLSSALAVAAAPAAAKPAAKPPTYDVIVRGGTIYDGSGAPGRRGDVGIRGDKVVAVGTLGRATAKREIDARGMAVAPGFINMLSWSTESLFTDPLSQSDIRQGVTFELLGEGLSMGPLSPALKTRIQGRLARKGVKDADWTTLGEYLGLLERRGVTPNVASFVGASTVRLNVIGDAGRKATPDEIVRMQALVTDAMREGAFGVSAAIEYVPANYADTAELTALAHAAAPFGGLYISHIRSEQDHLVDSVREVIRIARDAGVPAEIYHLKAMGQNKLPELEKAIGLIEQARRQGLRITADMYPYTATATGFDVTMPAWVQEGGIDKWIERLKDPAIRPRVIAEMRKPPSGLQGRLEAVGSPDNILVLGGQTPPIQALAGQTLAQIAKARGTSPEDTIIDLIIADRSRIQVAYFVVPEAGIRRVIALPWVSFGSDATSNTAEGATLLEKEHPRAYGTFARVLGRYVRDEKALTLADAVHRLSGLPASNLGLRDRGLLRAGYFADVVVFDPRTIADHSTFEKPHAYATGMRDVLVNGVPVLAGGEHTGAKPGRFVRKPDVRAR